MHRRTFALLALTFATAPLWAAASLFARDFSGYQPDNFRRLLASGAPLIVHVHADWCPVCRRQISIMNKAFKDPKFNEVQLVQVLFDTEKQFLTDFRVARQSTIIVFRGGKEVNRISYDTDEARIKATLASAL